MATTTIPVQKNVVGVYYGPDRFWARAYLPRLCHWRHQTNHRRSGWSWSSTSVQGRQPTPRDSPAAGHHRTRRRPRVQAHSLPASERVKVIVWLSPWPGRWRIERAVVGAGGSSHRNAGGTASGPRPRHGDTAKTHCHLARTNQTARRRFK